MTKEILDFPYSLKMLITDYKVTLVRQVLRIQKKTENFGKVENYFFTESFQLDTPDFGRGGGGSVSRCVVMVEEHFFLRPRGWFSAIRRQISSIIRYSLTLYPFCLSPDSQIDRCRSHLMDPRKRWPSPFRLVRQYSASLEHILRVKSIVSTVPWSLVCASEFMFCRQS